MYWGGRTLLYPNYWKRATKCSPDEGHLNLPVEIAKYMTFTSKPVLTVCLRLFMSESFSLINKDDIEALRSQLLHKHSLSGLILQYLNNVNIMKQYVNNNNIKVTIPEMVLKEICSLMFFLACVQWIWKFFSKDRATCAIICFFFFENDTTGKRTEDFTK